MVREVLLLDIANTRFASVAKAHDFLWVSSVDGVHKVGSYELDQKTFGDGPAQAANAYSEVIRRLNSVGVEGSSVVRIEHATASQDWRLQRMALWPSYFGSPTTAVSQGYQGKMNRQNMITVGAISATTNIDRTLISPGPNPGRASRVTRAGELVFIIGVRGETLIADGSESLDGLLSHTKSHIERSIQNIEFHLAAANLSAKNLIRIDAFLRSPYDASLFRDIIKDLKERTGGNFSVSAVACPLGGRTDIEISAIASTLPLRIERNDDFSQTNQAAMASGFCFIPTCLMDSGVVNNSRLPFGIESQFAACFRSMSQRISSIGRNKNLNDIVRLDLFLASPYTQSIVEKLLMDVFHGDIVPPVVWHGVDLPSGLLVDTSAVVAL